MPIQLRIIGILLFCFLFFGEVAFGFEYAKAKTTLKVIDEKGDVVVGATAGIGFFNKKNSKGAESYKGKTDIAGQFTASATTHGEFGYFIDKEGYYRTSGKYREWFKGNGKVKNGRWEPWNPTVPVVLKKIKNPVPMYAKRVREVIPTFDKPWGYDLQRGDWVAPYGEGLVSDFIFNFHGRFVNFKNRDESLTISFSNEADGIQEFTNDTVQQSQLRLPHNASSDGYKTNWHHDKLMNADGVRKNQGLRKGYNLIFRVRTVLDEKGNIIKANYGKIHAGIEFGYSKGNEAMVIFTYYFNPDGTRNLEFDPKQNLFRNLGKFEQVSEP